MENQTINKNTNKKAFVLFSTIMFVIAGSLLFYDIVETTTFQNNIIKLKYLYLQANINMEDIKQFVSKSNDDQIKEYQENWSNSLFDLTIDQNQTNQNIYYIILTATNNEPVRLVSSIKK